MSEIKTLKVLLEEALENTRKKIKRADSSLEFHNIYEVKQSEVNDLNINISLYSKIVNKYFHINKSLLLGK